MINENLDQLAINTIRTLSMDAVQKATCGHPGTPMALAPLAYVLWTRKLRYDPALPNWVARDRFVLSCGHASMLLYSLLHLAGVKDQDGNESISLEDITNFRQLHSPCAGHPEYGHAAGIETTTGPLGQGVANSVGMAMASKWFAARYGRSDYDIFEYNVYAVCSDGDMMEGVASEAASVAGHLQLDNLCWIYDDNRITIEGATNLAFSEDIPRKFEALGWKVISVPDANDMVAINDAFDAFESTSGQPTLIVLKSVIGFGAPNKQGSAAAHGNPLGNDEIKLAKRFYEWPSDQPFFVPDGVREHFALSIGERGGSLSKEWAARFSDYKLQHASEAAELECIWQRELPAGWDEAIPNFSPDSAGVATRISSGQVLNAIARKIPWLLGGAADLAPSTMTLLRGEGMGSYDASNYGGRNLHFGIREHSMAAICNGLSLCGLRPFGATFFVFTDYMRPAMRLSCLMGQPVIYVLTHDSIGLGEDGPTHQPVEHLAALRSMPNMIVARPGDAAEVAAIYREIMGIHDRPVSLVLSRQNVPTLNHSTMAPASGAARGAYVLAEAQSGTPEVIVIGSGSELSIAVEAFDELVKRGVMARVVSMPSWELFEMQDEEYRNSVLPPGMRARVAVEAGIRQGWDRYIGVDGRFVGMVGFGASGPEAELYRWFGITSARVVEEALALISKK
ncbi:MAG: transketolase [Schlesneria sp.]|nr:transketolase [Schlesneria sp.]